MAKTYVQPQNKSYELKGSYRETLLTALKDVQSAADRVYFPSGCKIETAAGPIETKRYKAGTASSKEVLQKVFSDLSDYNIASNSEIFYGKKGRLTLKGPTPGDTFGKWKYTSAGDASKRLEELEGDVKSIRTEMHVPDKSSVWGAVFGVPTSVENRIFLKSTKESNKYAGIRKKHSGYVVEFVEKPIEHEFKRPTPSMPDPEKPVAEWKWKTTPLSDALKYLEGLDKEIGTVHSVEEFNNGHMMGWEYMPTNKISLWASAGGQKYDVTVRRKERLFGKDRIDVTWMKMELGHPETVHSKLP